MFRLEHQTHLIPAAEATAKHPEQLVWFKDWQVLGGGSMITSQATPSKLSGG